MNIFYRKLLVFALILIAQAVQAQERLVITPHMVINVSAHGDEWILFDNQGLTEDYGCPIPQTDNVWNFFDGTFNWKSFFYPVDVIVDFGSSQQFTRLCLRKGGGASANGQVKIFASGTDATTWDLVLDHTPGGAECYDLNPVTTRYVKFTFTATNAKIREIEFYNTTQNTPVCAPAPRANQTTQDCGSPRFNMEEFIGSNTNLDIPPAKANAVGFVRNYHGIFLTEGYDRPDYPGYPNNEYNWRPEFSEEAFDYDFFFQGFKDIGLGVANSIHRAPPYLTTFAYKTGDLSYNAAVPFNDSTISVGQFIKVTERKPFSERFYPIEINMVLDDPNMFVEYADIMYQFTGRYGTNAGAANMKVANSNIARAGLSSVEYLENWNEPDKWWHKSSVNGMDFLDPWVEEQLGYFSPFEYAAMSSATYDGNGKTNGVENVVRTRYPNGHPSNAAPVGIQAADPNMKMVMAGLSELNTDYVRSLMFWFEQYRPDIEFPFDVINFHDYSNNAASGAPLGTAALSPEEYGLKEKLETVVEFRDRYLPEVELWLSEFGYDSNPYSIQSADCAIFCNNNCDSDECKEKFREIQAQWIVRSFLEIAAAGIDRAMVFNMRDGSPEASGGLYQTSGMVTYRGDRFQNKNSWYYVSSMKETLEGLKYDPSYVHPDENVRMYRFTDGCGGDSEKTVYAIWSPTSRAGTNTPIRERYEIELGVNEATLVNLVDGDMDGERSVLRRSGNGKMYVDVSERPKFIVLGDMTPDVDGCACDYIEYAVTGGGNTQLLNDEQKQIGGPLCVEGDTMYTNWNARAGQEAIFDLRANYDLSSIFIYSDTLSGGNVEIYAGEPGNWRLFNTWDPRNVTSYRWKVFDNFDLQTRYLRIKPLTDNSLIHEVAFCGVALESLPTCNDGIQNGDETGIDCGGSCGICDTPECPVQLSSSMFFDEQDRPISKNGGAIALVDEQDSETPSTPWLEPWANNTVAYIDLGQTYRIDKISLYDGNGSGNFKVRAGKPNSATTLIDIETNAWPTQWRDFDVNTETRYLTVVKGSGGAKVNELRICGVPVGSGVTPTCNDGIQNGNETGIDCGGTCPACEDTGDCTIQLSSSMFFAEGGGPITRGDNIIALVDEQDVAIPAQPWVFPWYNNATAYLDLGATYQLDSIYLYDGNGSGNFKVRSGRPSDRTLVLVDFETNAWPPAWRGFKLDVTTRYLTFRKGSPGARINEIRLCGSRVGERALLPASSSLKAAIQPNPSSGQSVLQYELSTDATVEIQLWSITGQQLRTLFTGKKEGGFQSLELDEQLAAGLYLIEIQTADTRKLIKWVVE